MAINPLFDATYYLDNNPDVQDALGSDPEAAWQHYQEFGADEGRAPNHWFDIDFYTQEYPDLTDAGLEPADMLEHFHDFGAAEGRAPNADIDEGSWLAYATADNNADLRDAFGIDENATSLTDEQIQDLSDHFFHWGIHEGRDGDPVGDAPNPGETYELTPGVDDIEGTDADDTFQAFDVDPDTGDPASTLNKHDKLDGGDGNDTLNIYSSDGSGNNNNRLLDSQTEIRNIENINIHNGGSVPLHSFMDSNGEYVLHASQFEGAEVIEQFGLAAYLDELEEGVTAAFTDLLLDHAVLADDDATAVQVQLNDVEGDVEVDPDGNDFMVPVLGVEGDELEKVVVNGTLADEDNDVLYLYIDAGDDVDRVTVNTAVTTLLDAEGDNLTTVDAAGSAGDMVINVNATDDDNLLDTIYTGSGDDEIIVEELEDSASTLTIDTADGDDFVLLGDDVLDADADVDIHLGDGDDEIMLEGKVGSLATRGTIDGGEGFDSIWVEGQDSFNATDYNTFNNVFTNFEQIVFDDHDAGQDGSELDANRLSDYESFVFMNGGHVKNVSEDQTLITEGNLTASGDGHLDITARNDDDGGLLWIDLNLMADTPDTVVESADIVVEGVTVYLEDESEIREANVNLQTIYDEDGEVVNDVAVFNVDGYGVRDLETLTISGNGGAEVDNDDEGSLTLVDASGMEYGEDENGDPTSGLEYWSDNEAAETIILGDGVDKLSLEASIYQDDDGEHSFDSIQNFNFVDDNGKFKEDVSDVLKIQGLWSVSEDDFITFDASGQADLDQALVAAADAAGTHGAAIFELDDNTYVFVDSNSNGTLDDGDTVVELTGTFDDLDALASALFEAA